MNTEKKTRAVLDTNVLVSSALSDGKPAEILELAENEEFLSITSPDIVEELRDVLTRDILLFTEKQVDELVSKILSISQVIDPQIELEVIEDDPDDDKILEAAIAGNADFIVFGDSHILDLEKYRQIPLHNPQPVPRENKQVNEKNHFKGLTGL
ncbi:MAG: putative toxin-antitoxin system toxin component, PIN family [Candidatus Nanohalobium sp.]